MKKILFASIFLILINTAAVLADDFTYNNLNPAELLMKKYDKDSSAHAVVLKEFGKAFITESADRMILVYEYHVKVKLFDSKAFESEGNVKINLRKEDNNSFETVRDISGVTTWLDENNVPHQAELNAKNIFNINENKYMNATKFAMPNLKNGCIIEYKYTIESPFFFNFHPWYFQSDIPKIYSEFNANIPALYNYNAQLRGFLKLTTNTAKINRECLIVGGTKSDCSNITYGMSNIPPFETEDYMTSPKNFLSAIYFELSDYTSLSTGIKMRVTKEWKDIDYSLKSNEFFGSQIKRKELMKERIKDLIANQPDEISKARAIYAYVQKNIKWDGYHGKYSDDGIRKALDNHTGSVGDINLALIAALSAAGINTEAVMLSTREHGTINRLYPTESDFNYVVARVTINEQSYFLDATDPLLGFGMLPMRCINDQGRVMSMSKPSYWTDLSEPVRKSKIVNVNLSLQPDGKLKGSYTSYWLGYEAYEKRKEIKKFNSVDDYIENISEKSNRIKITNYKISNIDSLDQPITESFEIVFNTTNNLNHDRITFNPFLFDHTTVNPFKLTDRNYPVDMGMASDSKYTLTLQIPDNYIFESGPQNVGLAMPNKGGSLISNFNNDNTTCTYSQGMQLNNAVYSSVEYPYLKEIFNKLIQSEKTDIVFKKK